MQHSVIASAVLTTGSITAFRGAIAAEVEVIGRCLPAVESKASSEFDLKAYQAVAGPRFATRVPLTARLALTAAMVTVRQCCTMARLIEQSIVATFAAVPAPITVTDQPTTGQLYQSSGLAFELQSGQPGADQRFL